MEPYENQEIEIDLSEILRIVKKNLLWIIASGFTVGLIGFLISVFILTPIYEASATMIVNTRQDQSASVTNDQLLSAKNLVDTYAIIIQSDRVLEPVIQKLNLNENYEELVQKVTVQDVNNTQVMRVSVQDPDGEKAKAIADEIVGVAPEIIMDSVEAGSVKVISYPTISQKPVSPNVKKNTAVATLVGVLLMFGVAMIRHLNDNTFKSELDIQQQLGLPILGVIPTTESCGVRES